MTDKIFDSLTEPIPAIRRDIQLIPVKNNGRELLFFHDSMGYLTPDFALDRKVAPVLSLITGAHSVQQITGQLNGGLTVKDLLSFVQLLDNHKVLESDYYRNASGRLEEEFEDSDVRKAAFAGESYPADPEKLKEYLSRLLKENEFTGKEKPVKALYAPHIDLRVGGNKYGEAFSTLKNLKPERVVILATAHYPGYYGRFYEESPFIGTVKNFQVPGREFITDRQAVQVLTDQAPSNGFTLRDRAHRVEHSIELHLLFISHLWKHNFEIVPILISGLDELYYHHQGELSQKADAFASQIRSLDDGKTFFLISGDLSHVGKKFGDVLPAEQLRENVQKIDRQFIEHAECGDPHQLLQQVGSDYDSTRICGFPPLYTFLKAFPGSEGRLINYSWWDESERESAVSFAAIRY